VTRGISRRALLRSMAAAPLVSTLGAQTDVDTDTITLRSGSAEVPAFAARPRAAGRSPGVIVVHDARGLSDHVRELARALAAERLVALAPDLRGRLQGGQPLMGAIEDLQGGLAWLAGHANVDAGRLAAIGFGWGAWRSVRLATVAPAVRRVVVFYGASPDAGYETMQAAVLAHYAEWDNQVTGNARAIQEAMAGAGRSFQYYVYPRTDQGFANPADPRYAPEAARLAWRRTVEFLQS